MLPPLVPVLRAVSVRGSAVLGGALLALAAAGAWGAEERGATPPPLRQGPGHPLGDHRHAPEVWPCHAWVPRLPQVTAAQCRAARLQPTAGRSVQGRTIYARDVAAVQPTRRVLVVGAIHGDELSSASLALHWLRWAQETPAGAHWRFIPVLNPDGLLARRASRVNARGVDLNRNFPTPGWAEEAPRHWAERTGRDPRRWPGSSPLSEPESRHLHEEMSRFEPDLIVSIHAPYGVLDFDGPGVAPSRLGRLYLDQVGIFPGSLGNYGGVHRRMPVVTIELPHALKTPDEAEMRQMWLDLLRWMDERLSPPSPKGELPGR